MLTAEQQQHFETFGFLLMREYFSQSEMEAFSSAFDELLAEDRQGRPFPGEKRQAVFGFIEKRPLLRRLVEDDRIYEPIEQLLGTGFVWIGSAGNLYVGDTGWHPDSRERDYDMIKVIFYLDPVGRNTGCLRAIPGSHRLPLHEDVGPLTLQRSDPGVSPFAVSSRDVPCSLLESQPGDVVFFNQNLWHSAFGGQTGRRMFTLNFGAKPTTDEHIEYLQRLYQDNLQNIERMQFTQTGRFYEESFLNSDRPRIRGMTAKLVELGFS